MMTNTSISTKPTTLMSTFILTTNDDNMNNAQGQYAGQYETARVGQYDGRSGQYDGTTTSRQYDGAAALYNYPPPQMSPR